MKVLLIKGIAKDNRATSLYTVLDSGGHHVVWLPTQRQGVQVPLLRSMNIPAIRAWSDNTHWNANYLFTASESVIASRDMVLSMGVNDALNNPYSEPLHANGNRAALPVFDDTGSATELAALQKVLQSRSSTVVVIHKFAFPMTVEKLQCLRPNTWLNDEVINFYMQMIRVRNEQACAADPLRRQFHFFSSFFMDRLLMPDKKYQFNNFKRWTKNFDVRDRDMIFYPVNTGGGH